MVELILEEHFARCMKCGEGGSSKFNQYCRVCGKKLTIGQIIFRTKAEVL